MMLNIVLGVMFGSSSIVLWIMLSKRLREVNQIPDHIIARHLQEDPPRMQVLALHLFHFRFFYREGHYQEKFWNIITKIIYKVHIFVLKVDNLLVSMLKRAKAVEEKPVHAQPMPEFWKNLNPNLTTLPENRSTAARAQDLRARPKHRVVETTRV